MCAPGPREARRPTTAVWGGRAFPLRLFMFVFPEEQEENGGGLENPKETSTGGTPPTPLVARPAGTLGPFPTFK